MSDSRRSYRNVHKHLELRPQPKVGGRGLFATQLIRAGEVVWQADPLEKDGPTYTWAQLQAIQDPEARDAIMNWGYQVDDDLFAGPMSEERALDDVSSFWNHSCDPNCFLVGQHAYITCRDVQPGEELTIDYGTFDAKFDRIKQCSCGAKSCRGRITPDDWKLPEVQAKYLPGGHMAPYLKKRIAALNSHTSTTCCPKGNSQSCCEASNKVSEQLCCKVSPRAYRNVHPNIELRPQPKVGGRGLFATAPIKEGSIVWSADQQEKDCPAYTWAQVQEMEGPARKAFLNWGYQVDDDLFSGPLSEAEAMDDVSNNWNHSCDPNTWILDEDTWVARRDIAAGEEICADYATFDATLDRIPFCACGSACCRGRVTPDDWKLSELQEKYRGHFMPYLARRFASS